MFGTIDLNKSTVQDSIEVPRLKDLKSHSFPNQWNKDDCGEQDEQVNQTKPKKKQTTGVGLGGQF